MRVLATLLAVVLGAALPAFADDLESQRRFQRGLVLADQGKTDEALEIFFKLTQDYPNRPEPYNNLAVIYAGQGQYEKARLALEQAVRIDPDYVTAQENLGDLYAKLANQAYGRGLQPGSPTSGGKKATLVAARQPVPSGGATDVLGTARGWAQAWSRKDAEAYLEYYAPDFKTPGGETRAAWEKLRRERIAAARVIAVDIESPTVTMAGSDRARVSFRQSYRSELLNTSSRKTLLMTRVDGRWRIREEIVGK